MVMAEILVTVLVSFGNVLGFDIKKLPFDSDKFHIGNRTEKC